MLICSWAHAISLYWIACLISTSIRRLVVISWFLFSFLPFSQVMPHSTTDLPSQAYASSTRTMTSSASYANGRLNGGASTTSLDNKWKRASLPVSDSYGDLRSPIDSARGRSGSITSTTSAAVTHRKSQYYDSSNHGLSREKVLKDSPIIAELRTNVIV